MRIPLIVIGGFSALVIGGLALTSVSNALGIGVAMTGILGLGAFLIYADIRASRNGQGDYFTPGAARRAARKEAEQAGKDGRPEDRRPGGDR